MATDLSYIIKKDEDVVQDCILPHLLVTALLNVPKDDGKHYAHKPWIEVLNQESIQPFGGLPRERQQKVAQMVTKITDFVLKSASPVNTYKELCVAVSMSILFLIKEHLTINAGCQAAQVSIKIVEEAMEFGDWGDIKVAREASNNIIKALRNCNLYQKAIVDGVSS